MTELGESEGSATYLAERTELRVFLTTATKEEYIGRLNRNKQYARDGREHRRAFMRALASAAQEH